VVLSEPESLTEGPAHQADILGHMGVVIAKRPQPADLIVDALIGYSLGGNWTGWVQPTRDLGVITGVCAPRGREEVSQARDTTGV
jgi:hypothetical protein